MLSKKRKAKAPLPGSKHAKIISSESVEPVSVAGPSNASTQVTSADLDTTQDSSVFASLSQSLSSAFDSAEEIADHDLPDNVNIMQFVESRASEIATLMSQVQTTKAAQCMQQLPRHMRRRAASHNANRVPRRLREKVAKEIEKAKKGKRPSRKHRRRPSHLLSEYSRRQRNFVWLETHIWFAKRFKMENLWGYKIPLHPNDKSVRSAYKASSQYVLLQDMSYLCCIELKGQQSILLEQLSHLTRTCVGFGAKMYLSGAREGHAILYHPHKFPYMCIGPVSFLWKPLLISPGDPSICDEAARAVSNAERQLWIWCHPMCYQELVNVLQNVFRLQEYEDSPNSQDMDVEQIDACKTCNIYGSKANSHDCKNFNKTVPFKKIKKERSSVGDVSEPLESKSEKPVILDEKVRLRFKRTHSYSGVAVTMVLLKDTLVRHRLVGPLSQAVIVDTLKPAIVSTNGGDLLNITNGVKWWEEFYQKASHRSAHMKQKELWEKMTSVQSPAQLPPGMVLGMTVKDPRLDLPRVKTKISSQPEDRWKSIPSVFTQQLPHSVSLTPLWEECIRNEVSCGKLPENELNKMRSQLLVPGTRLELGREESRVPVIVIQRPGHEGYGSGWDVIAPLGWSMAFWIAFVYRGARASGLRETEKMAHEAGLPLFPQDYPDTSCGMLTEESKRVELMTKHFRYPPDKRPNFEKLGILAPYFRPWDTLVSEWENQINADGDTSSAQSLLKTPYFKSVAEMEFQPTENGIKFMVLRDKKKLATLKEACVSQATFCKQKIPRKTKQHTAAWNALRDLITFVRSHKTSLRCSIVCIELKCLNKGKPCAYSGIYIPTSSDLSSLKCNPKYGGPVEHLHPVKKVPKEQKVRVESDLTAVQASKEDIQSVRLARPCISNLISHCDRKLVGFVDVGEYSFVNSCGCGVGHCSVIGFLEVLRICNDAQVPPTVLIRSQSSFQYRFASISVVTKSC